MPETNQGRRRLAQLMNDRRVELGLRWTDVAEAGEVSPETLRSVRRNTAPLLDLTKARIEKGLRWARGSVNSVLAGGEPRPLDNGAAAIRSSGFTPEEEQMILDAAEILRRRAARRREESSGASEANGA